MKVGLWLPPRKDLTKSITTKNPGTIDARIHQLFCDYLTEKGVDYTDDLDFRNAIIKNNKVYLNDFCMSDLDHFVWMGMIDRNFDSYALEVLKVLALNVKTHHSYEYFSTATDKFRAFSILHNHGIPVSEMYLVNLHNFQHLKPIFDKNTFVLKPRRGSFGVGIIKMDNYNQLRDTLEYHAKKSYYLEKFYPNDMAEWTGITVINGKVIYGFRKNVGKVKGWKVYDKDSIGGDTIYVKPNPEIEAISLKIGEVLGANFYGLDFIKTAEGYKVVDINNGPGIYYDFIQDLNIPIAELFFKKRLKK